MQASAFGPQDRSIHNRITFVAASQWLNGTMSPVWIILFSGSTKVVLGGGPVLIAAAYAYWVPQGVVNEQAYDTAKACKIRDEIFGPGPRERYR